MRRLLALWTALATFAAVLAVTGATSAAGAASTWTPIGAPAPKVWRGSGVDAPVRSGPPTGALRRTAADDPVTATFQVSYTGFTAQQQAAFQQAVETWSRIVVSSVPIRIQARLSSLEPGVLGSAGPGNVYSSSGSYYTAALANAITGRDLDTSGDDILAEFSNDPSLIYFGADGQPPSGTYDFPTIVLHEIGHGLGFLGDLEVVNGVGTYDSGSSPPTPFVYDRLVTRRTSSGDVAVLDYPRGSAAMGAALQSQALFSTGPSATAAAGGNGARLYAPATWEPGSSLGHLDEDTYPTGNINALMTPIADAREVIRDPGPISLAILEDTGWQLSAASDPTPPGGTASPSPSSSPSTTSSASTSPTPSTTASPSPSTSPSSSVTPSPSSSPSTSPSSGPSPSSPPSSFAPTPQPSPTSSPSTDGSRYTAVAPQRLLDTRDGTGAPAARIGPGGFLDLTVIGRGGVPGSATAVVLNVTAVGATTSTDIRVYPSLGSGIPEVSNLNLATGQTRANLVTVAVGPDGQVRLRNQSGSVHLLADLAGFYAPDANSTFFPLEPERLLDTRDGLGRLAAGQTRDLRVAGTSLVPSSATAVVLSVTAVGPTEGTDVRVYPTGTGAVPVVSNLNIVPGGPVPNLVLARVGDNGSVRLRNNAGTVHLIVDVFGYYSPSAAGALFRPLEPARLVDTRPDRLGAEQLLDIDTSGGVPDGATAVALNVTGVGASDATDIRLFPTPLTNTAQTPTVSTLNLVRGQTAAGAAYVRTGNGSAVRLYNNAGALAVTVDVAGWFGPA